MKIAAHQPFLQSLSDCSRVQWLVEFKTGKSM